MSATAPHGAAPRQEPYKLTMTALRPPLADTKRPRTPDQRQPKPTTAHATPCNHRLHQRPTTRRAREADHAVEGEQPHSEANQILNFVRFSPIRSHLNEKYLISDENLQLLWSPGHVGESRQVQLVRDSDRLGRAVAMLGQNQ